MLIKPTMTNSKTNLGTKTTTTSTAHSGASRAASASRHQSAAPAAMIEACDRLGEKLDHLASLAQTLAQAWQQNGEASGASPATSAPGASGAPGVEETPRERRPGSGPETGNNHQESSQAAPGTETNGGPADSAADARRLVDTFARSQGGWPEQASDLREAMEAIMAFLENQTAAASPKLDLSDILSRLHNLEEQQKNLQSQFSVSR
jgi:hypothetical protein